jgi:hypothetical protein
LAQQWGRPDLIVKTPLRNDAKLAGKKGIVMFEVTGWSDARGLRRFGVAIFVTTTVFSMSQAPTTTQTALTSGASRDSPLISWNTVRHPSN